jgi:hypothetical protein
VDGGEFFNGVCETNPGTCNGTIVEKPEQVWWIRLSNLSGVTGWTREAAKFDNKDAFG